MLFLPIWGTGVSGSLLSLLWGPPERDKERGLSSNNVAVAERKDRGKKFEGNERCHQGRQNASEQSEKNKAPTVCFSLNVNEVWAEQGMVIRSSLPPRAFERSLPAGAAGLGSLWSQPSGRGSLGWRGVCPEGYQ